MKPTRPTVTHDGRIFDRWEPAPDRGTWRRAWIGVVTVTVRSDAPEATAAELRTFNGSRLAYSAFITAMLNDGTLQGDPAKIDGSLWCCEATVTVYGQLVTYRQEVEIPQDFDPEPTREEERDGWFRLTGQYPKRVADILAEIDAKAVAEHDLPDGTVGVVAVGEPAAAPQEPAPAVRGGWPGWTRLSAPGDKCGARWRHEASGWEVKHCGHPTANWPYHAADPEHPGRVVVSHNGKGFRKLLDAMAAVEDVLSGTLVATNERCGPSTRRVLTRDELRAESRMTREEMRGAAR